MPSQESADADAALLSALWASEARSRYAGATGRFWRSYYVLKDIRGDRYDLTRLSCRHVRGESVREQRQMCDGDLDRSGRYSVAEFRDSRYSPYLGGVMSVSRYLALSDVVIALGG